jgi:hypothetical protein
MTIFDRASAGFRRLITRDRRELPANQDPIQAYISDFASRLPCHGRRANRVLHEIEDHLRETTDYLCRQGMNPAEAARAAVGRVGTPNELIRQFDIEAPIESEVPIMVRSILLLAALLSTLFAGLFCVMAWFDDAPIAWLIMKTLVSALIMGCSMILFGQAWGHTISLRWERELAVASALLSVAFGSAGGVFTAHLGIVTHDWEMYGFVGAALLILQGVLAAIRLLEVPATNAATDHQSPA